MLEISSGAFFNFWREEVCAAENNVARKYDA